MVNALITTTTIPVEPGVYGKITAIGSVGSSSLGIAALAARASTGPLGVARAAGSPGAVKEMYGPASSVDRTTTTSTMANLAREAAIGGAQSFVCVRVGTGGAAASRTLLDAAAANVGHLDHPYVGVYANGLTFTIRGVAGDATQKELVVYDGATLVQRNRFPAASGDEAAGLQTVTANAPYAVFTKTGAGSGVLAAVTGGHLDTTPGVDPSIANNDYSAAFALLSPQTWAALVCDSEAAAVHTALSQYLDTETAAGRFRTGAVGEPTSVAEATRRTNSAAINSALVRYIGNGLKVPNGNGTTRDMEGYLAAAQQAGTLSTLQRGHPMTWRVVPGAVDLVGAVDKASAIAAGMGYYEYSNRGYRTGAGISTLVVPGNVPIWALALHDGWKHFEHVATAFALIRDIGDAWDDVLANPDVEARPPNTDAGRAALVAIGNRTCRIYGDRGWLKSGELIADTGHPPTEETAYFTFDNLIIALRAERLVLELPFGQP